MTKKLLAALLAASALLTASRGFAGQKETAKVLRFDLAGAAVEVVIPQVERPSLGQIKLQALSAEDPNRRFFAQAAKYYSAQEIRAYVAQQLKNMFDAFYAPFSVEEDVRSQGAEPDYAFGLSEKLNAQWVTAVKPNLGGVPTFLSVHPSREKKAYLAVLPESRLGQEPDFFDLRGIYDEPKQVRVGGADYKISLKPNIFDKLASKVVFERKSGAGGEDSYKISARDLLKAIYGTGQEFALASRSYRFFFYVDMDDSLSPPRLGHKTKSLAFVIQTGESDAEFYHVPFEQLSPNIAYFTFYENQRVGLSLSADGEKLLITNPSALSGL
ncbi:MAG: hypothetical protein HY611_09405 [Elusimicrobia bacterium]|nr:hypothetical protein [Elusimicrobiota bacterium]